MSAATQNEMERLRAERNAAEQDAAAWKYTVQKTANERDYLVEQYEKAVGCGSQGYIHAAGHIYNAIVNAKCDVNAERFTQLMKERDLARRDYEVMNMFREAAEQDLDAALEREQALAAHMERIAELLDGTIESNLDTAPEWDIEVSQWLKDKPVTTLTKRDLIKQAEALEHVSEKIDNASSVILNLRAEYLRQKAETQDDY